MSPGPALTRHEVDDLFSVTCAAALDADVLAVCGAFPAEAMPTEVYGKLVADVRANGTPVIVDLSPPAPRQRPRGRGRSWSRSTTGSWRDTSRAPVDTPDRMRAGAERLLEAGAGAVIITRAEEPALVLRDGHAWELIPPRFERGSERAAATR